MCQLGICSFEHCFMYSFSVDFGGYLPCRNGLCSILLRFLQKLIGIWKRNVQSEGQRRIQETKAISYTLFFYGFSFCSYVFGMLMVPIAYKARLSSRGAFIINQFHTVVNYSLKTSVNPSLSGEYVAENSSLRELLNLSHYKWNVSIGGCCKHARYEASLSHFYAMHLVGVKPNLDLLPSLLKICAAVFADELGKALHGYVIKQGFLSSKTIAKSLLNMYAKFGSLYDCHKLFYQVNTDGDTVLWNILLSGYAGSHHFAEVIRILHLMHICSMEPPPKLNAVTFAIVLPVCARLKYIMPGRSIHALATKIGIDSHTLTGNALLSMYAKCGEVCEAFDVFNAVLHKDIVSWNALIAGYKENGYLLQAMETFFQIIAEKVKPNYATFANILPIFATFGDWYVAKEMHAFIVRRPELERDISVCNALVACYSKTGHMKEAELVFMKMVSKDMVSWNTIIAGFAANGHLSQALGLYHELISTGMGPDSVTLISILPVCAQLCALMEGKQIHNFVIKRKGLFHNIEIGNALVHFYAKCGTIDQASQTFNMMSNKDLISWNTLLAAYSENEHGQQMLSLLYQMEREGIIPDQVTILSILRGGHIIGTRGIREAHAYSMRAGMIQSTQVGNAIIDMYARCGDINQAYRTFKSLVGKNVVTSNSMIAGYVKQGFPEGAEVIFGRMPEKDLTTWNLMIQLYARIELTDRCIVLFHELQQQGMKPDEVTLISFLPVCSILASNYVLRELHGFTVRASFDDACLQGALIDTYSKCGNVKDAGKLFGMTYRKDLIIYTAMISGYAMCGMGKEALKIFSDMLESTIQPDHIVMTAVLAACSHAGLNDEGWKHFSSLKEKYRMEPTMEHYSCMVDLLARSGCLKEAYNFIKNMPMPFKPNTNIWRTLLGACKIYREVELGRIAADQLFDAEESCIGNYVIMSNIYAAAGRWDGVEEVRGKMKQKNLKKPAGCSWIELDGSRHVFVAGDCSHPERVSTYRALDLLDQQIKEPG